MNKEDIEHYFDWLGSNFDIGFILSRPLQESEKNDVKVYKKYSELEEFISFEKSKYGQSMENSFYIKFFDLNQKLCLEHIKEQDYYLIDQAKSKLVKFSNGGLYKEKTLISGAMDIYKSYYEDGKIIKIPDMTPRFNVMTKWFKKDVITRAANHYYVMPGAYEMARKDIKLKVENFLAFGFHFGPSGGLEGYYEDKGMKITDDGILTSKVDWSEEAKRNVWKEYPDRK